MRSLGFFVGTWALSMSGCQGYLTSNPAGSGASAGVTSDVPCDVAQVLTDYCLSCHRGSPPGKLLSLADLTGPSATEPTRSVAEEAAARMASSEADHMPPSSLPQPTAAEIEALTAWVNAGAPAGTCDSLTPSEPPVPICTSGSHWTGGNEESPRMHPGGACINCHSAEGEGPRFAMAGTLYASPYELDDCNGVDPSQGAVVVIIDAGGHEVTLAPNGAGNFFTESRSLALPYKAKVLYDGREISMKTAQTSGDCNLCHTETGASGAPGRIFLP